MLRLNDVDVAEGRKTMTRAGKEPAEDAKRAFVRAIKQAGLRVHRVEMFKGGDTPGRFVFGTANPEGCRSYALVEVDGSDTCIREATSP